MGIRLLPSKRDLALRAMPGMPTQPAAWTMVLLSLRKRWAGQRVVVMSDDLGFAESGSLDRETVSVLLTRWRQRLDPKRIPGLVPPGRSRRRGVSQAEVARLAGISERWYWEIESGRRTNFSPESLDALSHALGLSQAERLTLYLYALGREPAREFSSEAVAADTHALRPLLDAQLPHPAYLSDRAWNIVSHNRPAVDWFPWIPGEPNLMRWIFLHREAREQLVNWRDEWARPFLAQLRVALARHSRHEPLQRLRSDILTGNNEAREIWEACEAAEHPDGDIRHLRLPCHDGEEIAVRIMALVPMRNRWLRFVVLIPDEFQEVSR